MTPGQRKTARFIGLWLVSFCALVGAGLAWEFHAIALNDHATISEVVWIAWSLQPGPIALVMIAFTAMVFGLLGHLLWQSSDTYNAARGGKP